MRANEGQGKKESVLVVILAETRAYEHTFDQFKKNCLDVMDADLCLCVANNDREDKGNPFYQHAKYVWSVDESDDWGDAFDQVQRRKGLDGDWRKLIEIKNQWLGGVRGLGEHPGSAGILLFFRLFLKECVLKHKLTEQYDRFVITRSDFVHQVPHVPLSLLEPEYIWLPNGEDYGGYTDRHIIANSSDVLSILSISDRIIEEPQKLYSEMASFSNWNLETFIKFSYVNMDLVSKVRRFPYTMYSVRSADGHSRWSMGQYSEKYGYYIKYITEYKGSLVASLLIEKPEDWNKLSLFVFNVLRGLLELKLVRNLEKYYRSAKKSVGRASKVII